jgi:pyridoxine kinase
VHATGPQTILVTSYLGDETPPDSLDLVASDSATLWRVRTPKLDVSVNGAGDAIAALFFVHMLETQSVPDALSRAASSIYGLLRRTAEAGAREIMLVGAQEEFVAPSRVLLAQRV